MLTSRQEQYQEPRGCGIPFDWLCVTVRKLEGVTDPLPCELATDEIDLVREVLFINDALGPVDDVVEAAWGNANMLRPCDRRDCDSE